MDVSFFHIRMAACIILAYILYPKSDVRIIMWRSWRLVSYATADTTKESEADWPENLRGICKGKLGMWMEVAW